jgi:hypothetical protein
MKKQKGDVWLILLILLLPAMILFVYGMAKWECQSKWEDSGLPVRWGPMQGCQVKVPSGIWLPSETIRELDIKMEPQLKPNAQKDQG